MSPAWMDTETERLGFGLVGAGRMGLTYAECLTRYTSGT
jgi:hypothetical protein